MDRELPGILARGFKNNNSNNKNKNTSFESEKNRSPGQERYMQPISGNKQKKIEDGSGKDI